GRMSRPAAAWSPIQCRTTRTTSRSTRRGRCSPRSPPRRPWCPPENSTPRWTRPVSEPAKARPKRPLWTIVVLLLAALALWGTSRLTWFAEYRDGGVRGTVLYRETGAQHAGALVPLA